MSKQITANSIKIEDDDSYIHKQLDIVLIDIIDQSFSNLLLKFVGKYLARPASRLSRTSYLCFQ